MYENAYVKGLKLPIIFERGLKRGIFFLLI